MHPPVVEEEEIEYPPCPPMSRITLPALNSKTTSDESIKKIELEIRQLEAKLYTSAEMEVFYEFEIFLKIKKYCIYLTCTRIYFTEGLLHRSWTRWTVERA